MEDVRADVSLAEFRATLNAAQELLMNAALAESMVVRVIHLSVLGQVEPSPV